VKKSAFHHTPLHSTPPLGGFPSEYRHRLWCGKTRMVSLPDGEKISTITLFVLAQLRNVTDRRTDGRTPGDGNSRAMHSIARQKLQRQSSWKKSIYWCLDSIQSDVFFTNLTKASAVANRSLDMHTRRMSVIEKSHLLRHFLSSALAWRHTSLNSVIRNYCCRAREVTLIYRHINRSYLLTYSRKTAQKRRLVCSQ